jgi:hypothetical protein
MNLNIIRTNVQKSVDAMTNPNSFALTFEALSDLASKNPSKRLDTTPALPTLSDVLAACAPIQGETLFLGIAEDGLPLLLNLLDPLPGPILIAGEESSGKTRLMKTIAAGMDIRQAQQNIKYVVLTSSPDEWKQSRSDKCDGILSLSDPRTTGYLASLVEWAHLDRSDNPSIVLLIDNFDMLIASENDQPSLRWLFLRGPARRIWPIVTINSGRARAMRLWLDAFHSRLFGSIQDRADLEILTGEFANSFHELVPGAQFAMHENDSWLNFWVPALD